MDDGSEDSSRHDLPKMRPRPRRHRAPVVLERGPSTFNETETKGMGSRFKDPRPILDWLDQGNSEATGKRLMAVHRSPGRVPRGPSFETPMPPKDAANPPVFMGHRPGPPYVPYGHHAGSNIPVPLNTFSPWAPQVYLRDPALNYIQQGPEPQRPMGFDVVHDPSEPAKDVIFKLSLPIKEDFQPVLEEFCRLRRLGRFKDAKEVFENKLEHLSTVPYVLVQYGEMLLASGDYKSFRSLRHWDKYPSIESEGQRTAKDACLDKLEGNFWLLDFHAKVPQPTPEGDIFQAITNIVEKLSSEPDMGSTETQMISLCLTILGDLEDSLGESVTKRLTEEYVKQAFSWNQVYHRLLSENRIWDLRDILVAAAPLFGTSFLAQFLGVASFAEALDKLYEDWRQPETEDDESTNLGLLDLFTSLLLEIPYSLGRDRKSALLLEYSKLLAESVQSVNHEHLKTRPFIQWIIVKAISEMGAVPDRPDGLVLQDFSGLLLPRRRGVRLPIFIPVQPSDKPHWDMFSVRPNPQQRQVLQVALQAARYTGDYRLQAISLKLLILNSQEPKALMDALANLQLDTQGDHEGFLETCLSKYLALASDDDVDRALLTSSFEKLATILKRECNSKPFYAPKPSFLWARDVVTRLVAATDSDYDGDFDTAEDNLEFWNRQLAEYGARLPAVVTDFIRTKYNVRIPTPIQPAPIPVYGLLRPSPIPGELPRSGYQNAQYIPPGVSGQPHPPFLGNPGHLNEPMHNLSHINPSGPFAHSGPPPPPLAESGYYGVSREDRRPGYYGQPPEPPTEPTGAGFYGARPSSGGQQYSSHHNDAKSPPPSMKTGAQTQGIPDTDYSSEDLGIDAEYGKGPVTGGTPRKGGTYIPSRRRTTIHIDNHHLYDDTESSDSSSLYDYDPSEIGDSNYLKRYKGYRPPAPAPSDIEIPEVFEPSGPSGQSGNEAHSDPESETSITRIMTPSISITKVGNQQNLKIVSKLLEENEMSILMTNKSDPTKSKAYTVKDGVISKAPIPGPEPRRRSQSRRRPSISQSSLKTVRPRQAPPLPSEPRVGSPGERADGPAVTSDKEVTDVESTLSGRVQRAQIYMNQKADEWLRDNKTKPRRPSIIQPRPVRPAVPGGLAKAILTTDEEARAETEVYPGASAKDAERPSTAPEYPGSIYNDPSDSELPSTEVSGERKSFDLKGKKNNEPGHQPIQAKHDRLENQFSKLPERLVGRFERTSSQGLMGKKMPAEGRSVPLMGDSIHSEDEVGKKGQNERRQKTVRGADKLASKEKQSESDTDTRRPSSYRRGTVDLT